jgi:hypothetical protein
MIGAIRNTLIGKGVNSITNDPFKGYWFVTTWKKLSTS